MTDEPSHQPGTPPFQQIGTGHLVTRNCMGCNTNRLTLGSTGQGVRWRCAGCSADRAARRALKESA